MDPVSANFPVSAGLRRAGVGTSKGQISAGRGFRGQGLKLVSQLKDTWAIGNVGFKSMCRSKYYQRSG